MRKSRKLFTAVLFLLSSGIQANKLSEQFQKDLDNSLKDHSSPGAVLLVANDQMGPLLFASGESDIKNHRPMAINDTFRIASMSKTFLAAAILKLVDSHQLELDDLVKKYLANNLEVARIPNGDELTIRELLQMRSGIPDYYLGDKYNALFDEDENHIATPAEAIKTIYGEKPLFKPNQKYNYSNTNYVLLHMVLEQVTKKTLAQAMQDLIFQPLHLDHTYITQEKDFANKDFNGLTTHGYTLGDNKQFEDVTRTYDGNGLGDGAVVTNASELYQFLKALLQDKTVLSQESLKEMLHFVDGYGLGISVEKAGGDTYLTHNGTASGYSGQYYVDSENGWVIILTNSDGSEFIVDLSDKAYQNLYS
ncbi:D-alanyl-D-alanine carboxypeptidase precursor [Legionella massiliensis]|uniref:D-alanyl-D-alanine carboxypeptidase n=1 Tax=Legionella massiliensis TaxID=1034943 RepID=A0A078KXF3_9GAMM|nr:serine hydrolase domain-containing protein [Legionella massiliensis]CDZ76429.1 D-alanyl-D-alanine carboxypeptidase precursor [Legionella massiliensis]CEE12167.1 D-alanyl-D-alanine carboxypeptidase precursor [Legionella massiliensis]